MKQKPVHFLISVSSVLLIFIVLLVWWLMFILKSFQALNNVNATTIEPGFTKVNMEAYYNLYPADKPK